MFGKTGPCGKDQTSGIDAAPLRLPAQVRDALLVRGQQPQHTAVDAAEQVHPRRKDRLADLVAGIERRKDEPLCREAFLGPAGICVAVTRSSLTMKQSGRCTILSVKKGWRSK